MCRLLRGGDAAGAKAPAVELRGSEPRPLPGRIAEMVATAAEVWRTYLGTPRDRAQPRRVPVAFDENVPAPDLGRRDADSRVGAPPSQRSLTERGGLVALARRLRGRSPGREPFDADVSARAVPARFGERSRQRRRRRYLRRARELAFRDLGGFVFEARRLGRPREDIVETKLEGLLALDRELRGLEQMLADRRRPRRRGRWSPTAPQTPGEPADAGTPDPTRTADRE